MFVPEGIDPSIEVSPRENKVPAVRIKLVHNRVDLHVS